MSIPIKVIHIQASYLRHTPDLSSQYNCKIPRSYSSLVLVFIVGITLLWGTQYFTGLVAYAVYRDCDPLTSGKIDKPDQILPFLVTEKLGHLPGLPGLFVAAVYGGLLR